MSEPVIKTVMVVDDEEDVRQYLSMALTDAGFRVVTAVDGFEALQKVKTKQEMGQNSNPGRNRPCPR